MKDSVNVIIPSVEISDELVNCLNNIDKINGSNFFVTIVIDHLGNKKIPKTKYRINKLVTGKINMSEKRNLAAKKFNSKYIAFIDSDAYPNKQWLTLALKYLKQKKGDIVGGPGIPFPKQKYSEKITYLSKRSFFVTGYLNFRKYKAKARLCDWLESCNLILERKFFLKYKGMSKSRYTGEDKEFFERVRKKNNSLKVYYSPDLFIYHKERGVIGFLLQRLCFGMDFFNLIKTNSGLNGFQPIFPILILFSLSIISFLNIYLVIGILILANSVIFFSIIKYIKSFKSLIFTLFTINLANLTFALGGVLTLFGLKNLLINKIYLYSRRVNNEY